LAELLITGEPSRTGAAGLHKSCSEFGVLSSFEMQAVKVLLRANRLVSSLMGESKLQARLAAAVEPMTLDRGGAGLTAVLGMVTGLCAILLALIASRSSTPLKRTKPTLATRCSDSARESARWSRRATGTQASTAASEDTRWTMAPLGATTARRHARR